MYKYVKGKDGITYAVDFFCNINKRESNERREGTTFVSVESKYSSRIHKLSVYYRHERTWDDHMGNTPCGYFCIVPLPTGERKRVYMYR